MIIKHIIPQLSNAADPYHAQHVAVIHSLADVKSAVLLLDVAGGDDFMYEMFVRLFDVGSDMKDSSEDSFLRADMVEIMISLIDEVAEPIPSRIVDAVMAQFLRVVPPGGRAAANGRDATQTTLLPKSEPVPYTMAKQLCVECQDRLARPFGSYFNGFVLEASSLGSGHASRLDSDDGNDKARGGARGVGKAPSEDDLKDLLRVHDLIRELWRAAPDVLVDVVPQITVELMVDNAEIRRIAVQTVGDMISGIGTRGPPPPPVINVATYPPPLLSSYDGSADPTELDDLLARPMSSCSFMQKYPDSYKTFLSRLNDPSASVRASWTTAVGQILFTSAGGIGLSPDERSELVLLFGPALQDPDERGRLAAIKAIQSLPVRDLVYDFGRHGGVDKPDSVLNIFAARCRDVRAAVRVEAIIAMAQIWAAISGELIIDNEAVVSSLGGITSWVFNTYYAQNPDTNILLDRILFEYLLPFNYPIIKKDSKSSTVKTTIDVARVRLDRFLLLMKNLDAKAQRVLNILVLRQPKFSIIFSHYIKLCEAYNGGTVGKDEREQLLKRMNLAIESLVAGFPDAAKATGDLMKFAKTNDRRAYMLVKFATDRDSDYMTVVRSFKELVKRIGANAAAATALDTIVPLFYRSSYLVLHKVNIGMLFELSKSSGTGGGGWQSDLARDYLKKLSEIAPMLIDSYSSEWLNEISRKAPTASKQAGEGAEEIIKTYSAFAWSKRGNNTVDEDFADSLMAYALYSKKPSLAKHAVKILMSGREDDRIPHAVVLMGKLMQDLSVDSPYLVGRIAAIGKLELYAPTVTLAEETEIKALVEQILTHTATESSKTDPHWVPDAEMDPELSAKCIALRIMANRFIAVAVDVPDGGHNANLVRVKSETIRKLLASLIKNKGEMPRSGNNTPRHYKSRLVAKAATITLKLCTIPVYDEALPPEDFDQLALVAQDPVPEVRHRFVDKVRKRLVDRSLRMRFYTIFFLLAFEPSIEFKTRIESWLRDFCSRLARDNNHAMASIITRLISLLAHHPDYLDGAEPLADTSRYLVSYINIVATEDNLGRLYAYTEQVKQVNDAIDPAKYTPRVRILCDISKMIMRKWQAKKGWSYQANSAKLGLPIGLFGLLSSHSEAQAVAETDYVPEGVEDRLDALIRSFDKKGRELVSFFFWVFFFF